MEYELIASELCESDSAIRPKWTIHSSIWHDDLTESEIPSCRSRGKCHDDTHGLSFRVHKWYLRRRSCSMLHRDDPSLESLKYRIIHSPTSWYILCEWWLVIGRSCIDCASMNDCASIWLVWSRDHIRESTARKCEHTERDEISSEHRKKLISPHAIDISADSKETSRTRNYSGIWYMRCPLSVFPSCRTPPNFSASFMLAVFVGWTECFRKVELVFSLAHLISAV